MQDGWNITGDTFVQDEDGYFYYQARSDDMIVSSGYNIAGPGGRGGAAGASGGRRVRAWSACRTRPRGQLVTAFVVLRDRDSRRRRRWSAELQDFVKQQIAPYKYPRAVEFVPRCRGRATGKVQRFVLRGTGRRSAG